MGCSTGVDALVSVPGILSTSGLATSETPFSTPTLSDTDPPLARFGTSMYIGSAGDGERISASPGDATRGGATGLTGDLKGDASDGWGCEMVVGGLSVNELAVGLDCAAEVT